LSSQNSNSNTYSSSSTQQNYQQKTTSPSTNYNVYTKGAGANTNYVPVITDNYHPKRNQAASALSPQEENVANAYPADFEEMSIPNQASGAKAADIKSLRPYSKATQPGGGLTAKELTIKASDMSFLEKNLIKTPEDKPEGKGREGHFPGPAYGKEDVAEHYKERKEDDTAYIYDPKTYK
ncbi:MAG: hypothetical protein PHQ96_08100, partial [Candidatus Omnitrophica bacterium]|nr:hypothetical protein [Candidatus Omnitrophota bacterium]